MPNKMLIQAALAATSLLALSAPAQAQLMKATVTGTVSAGFDAYRNSVYFGPNGGYNLAGLQASVSIIYDAGRFGPNQGGAPGWNFTHAPNWPNFLGTVGQGPIMSASFTINGITLATDVSGTYENGKLAVENPAGNNDNWNLYGGDRRFTWCPNDAQCIETTQLSASQGYGSDLFGGQHAFSPAEAFSAGPAAGRSISAYVRLIENSACPQGMCPQDRFADHNFHWVEFVLDGSQLSVSAVVPEPGTWALMLGGLGALGLLVRCRRRG